MGDISTHNEIFSSTVLPRLKSIGISGSLAQCYELGNFLRDVSQFRDPYSQQIKKIELYKEKDPWIGQGKTKQILSNLFGPHPAYDVDKLVVSGAWGEWFKSVMKAFGTFKFCDQAVLKNDAILNTDYERLFEKYFSQYYPHEHLDFPPTGVPTLLGDWTEQSLKQQTAGGPGRRVLSYLDDDAAYIATHLLLAERSLRQLFVRDRVRDESWVQDMQETLVRLGRASHAIEDFYFHSNFVEAAFFMQSLGDRLPTMTLQSFFFEPRVGSLAERPKRILFRRCRTPTVAYNKQGIAILSKESSGGTEFVFTGRFASADLLHTLEDALTGIASDKKLQKGIADLASTLFNYMLNPELRKQLVKSDGKKIVEDDESIKKILAIHTKEVQSGYFANTAKKLVIRMGTPALYDAIKHASVVDRASLKENEGYASIGEVILKLSAQVEANAQNVEIAAQSMDNKPQDIFYAASENVSEGENIGTHSLMAKDSIRSEPLRKETDALARFSVGKMLDTLLVRTKLSEKAPYANWDDWLNRLMCHPAQAPDNWAVKFLSQQAPLERTFVASTLDSASAGQRIQEGLAATAVLEEKYRALYRAAAKDWDAL